MVPDNSRLSLDSQQQKQKKKYQKPSVQIYGNLAEVTQSAPHSHRGTTDNFNTPGNWAQART